MLSNAEQRVYVGKLHYRNEIPKRLRITE